MEGPIDAWKITTTLAEHVEQLLFVIGHLLIVLWAIGKKIDGWLLRHLDDHIKGKFFSHEDGVRLEEKLDKVIEFNLDLMTENRRTVRLLDKNERPRDAAS